MAVTSAQAIDFPAGAIDGTIVWNGAPATNSGGFYLHVPGVITRQADFTGDFTIDAFQPGAYTFGVFTSHCPGNEHYKVGEAEIEVLSGSTTTATVDISGGAGRVVGSVSVNGAALTSYTLVDQYGCPVFPNDASAFAAYLPPGARTFNVFGPSGLLGSFGVEVVAGETMDVGALNFESGAIDGTIVWNGAPATNSGGFYLHVPGVITRQADFTGDFTIDAFQPGAYTFGVFTSHCPGNEHYKVGEAEIEVLSGSTTTATVDISGGAGRVVGSVSVNGAALTSYTLVDQYGCPVFPNDASAFAAYLPPGARTFNVFGPSGLLGSFGVEVVAGETMDVGALNFESGAIDGTIVWNGAPATNSGGFYLHVPGVITRQADFTGDFTIDAFQPGAYTFGVFTSHCPGNEHYKVGEAEIEVLSGSTTTATVDISGGAGRVVGSVSVNGAALTSYTLVDQYGCPVFPNDASAFAAYLPPGARTFNVFGPSGLLGSFSVDVVAGETTDVDFGTTQVGQDVSVELSGGLATEGGLGLTFDSVTTGGNTVVVESGFGPAPPTGYQIVTLDGDARYWDIETTAEYDGVITVCIHYDESELTNPASEGSLVLMHDAGSGFEDITTTIDTDANIVCGETTSLSPFAVMEPLVVPNRAPQAADDDYSTTEDVALNVAAPGVLSNDSDADSDPLSASVVTGPTHGSLNLDTSGALTYTPPANFNGIDSFTYTAGDGTASSAPVTVTIAVGAVNDPPTCATVTGDVATLSPPNHKLQLVKLAGGSDVDGDAVTIKVTGVTQDEPVNGQGDGDTGPDAVAGAATNQVSVRAERGDKGDGRVYRIAYVASDGKGGTCSGTWDVAVPKSQGKGATAVDSGQTVNSFGP